jgi:hypothetical protein
MENRLINGLLMRLLKEETHGYILDTNQHGISASEAKREKHTCFPDYIFFLL